MTQLFIDKEFAELLPLIDECNRLDAFQRLEEFVKEDDPDTGGLSAGFVNVVKSAVENAVHVPMIFPYAWGLGFSFLFSDENGEGAIDIDADDESPFVIVTVDNGDGSEVYETHPVTELTALFNKLGAIQKVNERILNNIKQLINNQYDIDRESKKFDVSE